MRKIKDTLVIYAEKDSPGFAGTKHHSQIIHLTKLLLSGNSFWSIMTGSFLLAIALWNVTNQKSNEDLYEIFGEFSIVLWVLELEGHLIYLCVQSNLPFFLSQKFEYAILNIINN